MGNTKYIAFSGDVYRGEESFFDEQALLIVAHGDHVAVKVFHCYLHYDGESDSTDESYVIGHLTSHSMSGFSVVDHIISHMHVGHILYTDADNDEHVWLNVHERKAEGKFKLTQERR